MATKTFEELKQLAIQIRDEKTNKQNTATRVGTAMLEHINKLEQDYYDKTKTDEELKERDDKLTELELKSLTLKSIEPYKSFGYLNTDGTITGINNWKTYNKIPVSEGDSFSAIFGMIPILEGATAVVIFNSEGSVIKTINKNEVNYTFEQDGFLSFCYNTENDNEYNVRTLNPILNEIGNINEKINTQCEIIDILGYEKIGYLNADGTIVNNLAWRVYDKIPVSEGDSFSAVFGMVPILEGTAAVVVFNSESSVVKIINKNEINYTFTEDGFLSFCYNTANDNDYYVLSGKEITLKMLSIYLLSEIEKLKTLDFIVEKQKDIEQYKKIGFLNTEGKVTGITDWYTYDKIPVSAGDSFSAVFGMIPILEGATAVVIFNSEGLVVKTINTTNVNYTFEQDGFLSFCYNYRYDNSYNIIFRETLKKYISEQVGYKKSIKWTAIGDSITAGNQSNTGTSYATFAAGMLGEQVTLQKLGYWGQRIQNVLVTTAFNAISDDVDIVTMNLGSNDIFAQDESQWGDVDEVIAKSKEELVEDQTTFENLRIFFEKMRETHSSTLIYVINPIKRAYSDGKQERFNNQERKLCNYYSIPVLDAFNETGIRYDDTVYKSDGIHPNDAGKLVFARWLVSKISFLNL